MKKVLALMMVATMLTACGEKAAEPVNEPEKETVATEVTESQIAKKSEEETETVETETIKATEDKKTTDTVTIKTEKGEVNLPVSPIYFGDGKPTYYTQEQAQALYDMAVLPDGRHIYDMTPEELKEVPFEDGARLCMTIWTAEEEKGIAPLNYLFTEDQALAFGKASTPETDEEWDFAMSLE